MGLTTTPSVKNSVSRSPRRIQGRAMCGRNAGTKAGQLQTATRLSMVPGLFKGMERLGTTKQIRAASITQDLYRADHSHRHDRCVLRSWRKRYRVIWRIDRHQRSEEHT